MIGYDNLIMEALQGDTPKQKYEFLQALLERDREAVPFPGPLTVKEQVAIKEIVDNRYPATAAAFVAKVNQAEPGTFPKGVINQVGLLDKH